MPPLEDELRAALHGRATTLAPLPDPLPGVERRVRGLRRRRAAALLAGTALAVLTVAGALPLLIPDRGVPSGPRDIATAPSAAPSSSATTPASPSALDPDEPWGHRGRPDLGGDAPVQRPEVGVVVEAWSGRHPGAEVLPLFGQVQAPSGRPELVVLSTGPAGPRWGVVTVGPNGAEVLWDVPLQPDTTVLVALLPGAPGPRVLALAAPEVERLQLVTNPGDQETRLPLTPLAPGVATGSLAEGPSAEVRGLRGAQIVAVEVVPDTSAVEPAPANVLDWPTRGTPVDPAALQAARQLLAADRDGADPAEVEGTVLVAGDDDAGRRYLLGQFWLPGDEQADTIGVVLIGQGGDRDQLSLLRPLAAGTDVAALYLPPPNEQSRSELVVVPRPGTGQVQYAGDDASEWTVKATSLPDVDAFVQFERNPEAERIEGPDDRIRLLDGDGTPFAEVTVFDLLCGKTSCG